MVWAISLPVLFVEVSETVIHVVGTVLLGRVGSTELAAFAIADTLFDVVVVPMVGVAGALQVVVARRLGQGRLGEVRQVFLIGMGLILALGLVVAAVVGLAAGPISGLLSADADIAAACAEFLRPASLGLVFLALTAGYGALYVGLGRARILIAATLLLAAVDITVGYALIFGNFGFPRMGIEGAGWALVCAEIATFTFLTSYTLLRGTLGARSKAGTSAVESVRPLARLVPGISLQALVEGLRWLLFFVVMGYVSEDAVALSSVLYACYAVFLIPPYALAEACQALVSRLIGSGGSEIGLLVKRAEAMGLVITAPLLLVSLVAPELVLSLVTSETALIEGGATSLRVLAVAMLAVIPAEIWLATMAGTGDTDAAFGVELLLSSLLIVLAFVTGVLLGLPLPVVWGSLLVASLVSVPISRSRVLSESWRERLV